MKNRKQSSATQGTRFDYLKPALTMSSSTGSAFVVDRSHFVVEGGRDSCWFYFRDVCYVINTSFVPVVHRGSAIFHFVGPTVPFVFLIVYIYDDGSDVLFFCHMIT